MYALVLKFRIAIIFDSHSKLYKPNNALVAIGSSAKCCSKPSQVLVVLLGVSS